MSSPSSRRWVVRHGKPNHLRSDNGPEFIAYAIQKTGWPPQKSKPSCAKLGSPWENGHIESFHDKLRGECRNRELFGSLLEVPIILEQWHPKYIRACSRYI